ncbi:hypothetical protein DICPUDRAFT_92451 [Dictyostelium purpureum]|uniref:Uncharacterized protein n=1 Tax=Dictyostelium purpureum TaxID=5786 RepID=F0ZS59_DICPU|nr:uncharacterized protein DICPUDRAFT_92451 [Dictyostelium purpureum]EGC33211.1 hypothetical protein DICPUDRAFT_92451 [Dictyostelium purpureum]|eukprot:XP_003290251.1 hypothetical protein DICPUDRAFT_92451 [Dictyostelium purpureum]
MGNYESPSIPQPVVKSKPQAATPPIPQPVIPQTPQPVIPQTPQHQNSIPQTPVSALKQPIQPQQPQPIQSQQQKIDFVNYHRNHVDQFADILKKELICINQFESSKGAIPLENYINSLEQFLDSKQLLINHLRGLIIQHQQQSPPQQQIPQTPVSSNQPPSQLQTPSQRERARSQLQQPKTSYRI